MIERGWVMITSVAPGGREIVLGVRGSGDIIGDLSGSSKMNADWKFLMYLFKIGRERADKWLATNFDHLGVVSTVDLKSLYL